MSRLKIVHAAKFYPPVRGGMETVVADLCEGTADEWTVRVVAANVEGRTVEEIRGGVQVIRAATVGTSNSVPLCPTFALRLWSWRADCVVLHEPNPIAATALFAYTPATHLIVWHHSDLLRPVWAPPTYGRLQRRLYRRADCVIVSSARLGEHSPLVQQARRVEVVPFGIPLPSLTGDAHLKVGIQKIRARLAGPIVLFVGRFVYYKGVDVLIDAMAGCPGTVVLVGEGPLEGDLRRQVAERGLSARVVFAGNVQAAELQAYYAAADVFVLPSTAMTETFGVVQVEAMAAGVPVISTDLPTGVPWVNQHERTGLVVPPGDVEALRNAIRRVLLNPTERSVMGARASERAQTMFDRRQMIERFKAVVESVVEAPPVKRLASDLAAHTRELGRRVS